LGSAEKEGGRAFNVRFVKVCEHVFDTKRQVLVVVTFRLKRWWVDETVVANLSVAVTVEENPRVGRKK
jgi:hypothetical protein